MSEQLAVIQEIYLDHLQEIYNRSPEVLMTRIRQSIEPHTLEIAETFYRTIQDIGEISDYLSTEQVVRRLIPSMSNWVNDLFKIRNKEEALRYIEAQFNVGHIHARIKLPPHLFNCGVRVIKREIMNHLVDEATSIKEYRDMALLVNMLIDATASLMNESFFSDLIQVERQSQSLQFHVMGQALALKCEKLRADTFSWQNRTLNQLLKSGQMVPDDLPLISHTDIGMWVNHKATLYFKDSKEVISLTQMLTQMDTLVRTIFEARKTNAVSESGKSIDELNEHVLNFTTLLSTLSEQAVAMETARDSLTKLFNRRYLDTVMQRETKYSIRNRTPFTVMLMDIDHFKSINDEHGHQAGDEVLSQLAETLSLSVRAGDFLFRYGGEEFLLLLPDMKIQTAEKLADTLCKTIAHARFEIQSSKTVPLTISIGVAEHDFSSDYKRVINEADKALYAAKNSGRNRYVIAA